MASGRYIALEGIEGCGKSTHAARLADGLGATLTRETGGTALGRLMRDILHDPDHGDLTAEAEALLIAADRAQHMREVVLPALAAGGTVVSDRSVYSSLAYQGHGRALDLSRLREVNDWALAGRWPDVVVVLDVPSDLARARLAGRALDRFEREDAAFFDRVARGFRCLAAEEPGRIAVVDATPSIDEVFAAVLHAVGP